MSSDPAASCFDAVINGIVVPNMTPVEERHILHLRYRELWHHIELLGKPGDSARVRNAWDAFKLRREEQVCLFQKSALDYERFFPHFVEQDFPDVHRLVVQHRDLLRRREREEHEQHESKKRAREREHAFYLEVQASRKKRRHAARRARGEASASEERMCEGPPTQMSEVTEEDMEAMIE